MNIKIKKIKICSIKNNTGNLIPFQFNKLSKKKIKRIFFLNIKKNAIRGNHAHKKCTQIFYQLNGLSELILSNKHKTMILQLNEKKKIAVIVNPKTWVQIKSKSNNCCVMVLCDADYKAKDYIRKFENL